jgi:hypothetical protein
VQVFDAYCQKKSIEANTVKFLFDGSRVAKEDTPETVRPMAALWQLEPAAPALRWQPLLAKQGRRSAAPCWLFAPAGACEARRCL